jgi:unsaturated rhamnogalacturonyl hydrolase
MRTSNKLVVAALTALLGITSVYAQANPLSQQMADTAMDRIWTDSPNGRGIPPKWVYDYGVVLNGLKALWLSTGDKRYLDNIKRGVDTFVNLDGTINTFKVDDYNLDQLRMGSAVLFLYQATGEAKYRKAAELLRSQLKGQPRTKEGGFWHKKIYPNQMWLDGLYMAEPFYAEYSHLFGEDNWNDIADQFIWMEQHARDAKTGLLYHGWDESKQMAWADKTTGRAPMFWGRAMGWYAMALVDVLDYFPKDHPKRDALIAILNREIAAVEKVQDKESGTWWLILDMAGRKGNYTEASASCMFVYTMAKGYRMGYLPAKVMTTTKIGWTGIQKQFLLTQDGNLSLQKTIGGAGLGGNPYRDGSFNYYTGEKVVTNDPKGVGAFLLAATEMEKEPDIGKGKTVVLDDYFNHETKKDGMGRTVAWHYKWEEWPISGYGLWGNIFNSFGARTEMLSAAPRAANLSTASVYIIVDPDTPQESPDPKYIQPADIKAIGDWVKAGGVLALMANDVGNCELQHLDELAKVFGIHFNEDSLNRVQGSHYEQGKVLVTSPNEIFRSAKTFYLKEISSLTLSPPATPLMAEDGKVIMATAKYGKGTVFAVGDPWFYNEYTNGKLPPEYENFKAAQDLSRWLLTQAKAR